MKKFLTALSIIFFFVIVYLCYELKQVNNKLLSPEIGNSETISQLENELNLKIEELSVLQAEYQQLKDTLSGNNELIDDTTNTNITNNDPSNSEIDSINSREIGLITQIYNDGDGNKKLEIDYVQLKGYGENGCEYPLCIINDNPKLRTFIVSDNVQVVMCTLNGIYEDQIISFDRLKEILNNNSKEYSYFKDIPFQITIENNVIVKIEEQFVS